MADETVADLAFDGAGNVYAAGTFTGAVDFNPDPNVTATATAAEGGSGYVWKLNFYGNLAWARTIDGTSAITALATTRRAGWSPPARSRGRPTSTRPTPASPT